MEKKDKKGVSSFSVILVMVVLMVIGFALIPMLNIQYTPTTDKEEIEVYYTWNDASSRVIELEVTSKIEGIMSSIEGIKGVRSVSNLGNGYVIGTLKSKANMQVIRLELASRLRSLYNSLPKDMGYPIISANQTGVNRETILTYTLNAPIPPCEILRYAENNILKELSRVEGVSNVEFNGATPFFVEIKYDANLLNIYGLGVDDVRRALQNSLGDKVVLGSTQSENAIGKIRNITVKLGANYTYDTILMIPIKSVNNRIIYLRDIAEVQYKESEPNSYYRINGLNTININIYADKGVNSLKVAKNIKEKMASLEKGFSKDFAVKIVYDSSEHINKELEKIYIRTFLSLLILLCFVFAVNRNWRYLFVILATLIANILIAFIFYVFFNVEVNIYSLAAITVSLGMIIDTSIIMIDHYSRYKNRKVFIAILGALLTTVCSVIIVFFLPMEQRQNLDDFSLVMIINLSVSLVISLAFIPAIISVYPVMSAKKRRVSAKKVRLIRRSNASYSKFILFCRRHRWAVVLIFIFSFGLPLNLLPKSINDEDGKPQTEKFWANIYNKTIGGSWYQNRGKDYIEVIFGGTISPFIESVKGSSSYRSPARTKLTIRASMPEGCSVKQLNDVMVNMENYLNRFPEIESYHTKIQSYENGVISVYFTEEAEKTNFPEILKSKTVEKAINFGGAVWYISGRDPNSFSNQIYTGYKPYRIEIKGYNYDKLYEYAEKCASSLKKNRRVKDIDIYGRDNDMKTEFFIDYNAEIMKFKDISSIDYYGALREKLFYSDVTSIYYNDNITKVKLLSANAEDFDLWHIYNDAVSVKDKEVKLSNIGTIEKRKVGGDIYKHNQEYVLHVAFDFIGSNKLAEKVLDKEVKILKTELPVGYSVERSKYSWWDSSDTLQYALLALIIVIIYFICAILFESLLQPLVIISLVPISFIGVFLTFYITDSPFDQGGFASMVLLCGLVVNAGIYLINEYNQISRQRGIYGLNIYLKAFNRKIVPISLTVVSTVLGLIPFLINGSKEVFWFSFAVGAMGGMMFSFISILVALPIFLKFHSTK